MAPKPVAVSVPENEQGAGDASAGVDAPKAGARAERGAGGAPGTSGADGDGAGAREDTVARMIDVGLIDPNPHQPRTRISDESLESLVSSIREHGVLQPVVVRPAPGGRFELVAGERRWRSARLAGLEALPAIVRDLGDAESSEIALIENVQREDLDPIDRSDALCALSTGFGLSQERIAERIGLDRSTVANLMRLRDLSASVRALIRDGGLGVGHAKALLGADPLDRESIATRASAEGWSVRALEQAARESRAARSGGGPPDPEDPRGGGGEAATGNDPHARAQLDELERSLGEHLGTRVELRPSRDGKRGRLIVHFYDLDQFDGLLARMNFVSQ